MNEVGGGEGGEGKSIRILQSQKNINSLKHLVESLLTDQEILLSRQSKSSAPPPPSPSPTFPPQAINNDRSVNE